MTDGIITTLFCCVLVLLAIWAHDANADEFVHFKGCKYTDDSSHLTAMRVHGPSDILRNVYVRKNLVVAIHPVERDDNDNLDCSMLLLSTGRTLLVIGSEREIFQKLFKPTVE